MNRSDIKKQFEKTIKMANKFRRESQKLNKMIEEYYGEDDSVDPVRPSCLIDVLDYGQGTIGFEEFDKIMKEAMVKD